MNDQQLMTFGLWGIGIAAIFQTLFIVAYSTRPWWTHYVGKAMFFKSLALTVALWVSFSNNVLDPYPHQLLVAVLGLWFVAITVVAQCIALFVQIGHDRREKRRAQGNERYREQVVTER